MPASTSMTAQGRRRGERNPWFKAPKRERNASAMTSFRRMPIGAPRSARYGKLYSKT